VTIYRNAHNTEWGASETRRQLGICPSQLRVVLAVLSHERAFGQSPTRAAVAQFLGLQPNGYGLIHAGWITSRVTRIAGQYIAIWKATDIAKRALGLEDEERRSA
jgi:hypothetical protein